MSATFRVEVSTDDQVGDARRQAADFARSTGADELFQGRFALVVTEAARNVLRHGGGGEILLRCVRQGERVGLEMLALDRGPGMKNVAECLRDGFSTGGTAGEGMGAMQRQSDEFEVYSRPGEGTATWCRAWPPHARPPSPEALPRYHVGVVNVPIKGEEQCGDAWSFQEGPSGFRLLVADGLGHGPQAAAAANTAVTRMETLQDAALAEAMCELHRSMMGTRGAAVALVELRGTEITVCGVGNISGRLTSSVGPTQHLVSMAGTVGANLRSPQEFKHRWSPEQLLIMHSDGLTANWRLEAYPGLGVRHPALIAGVLYRDFKRGRDDASVVVVRARKV